MSGDQVSIIGW